MLTGGFSTNGGEVGSKSVAYGWINRVKKLLQRIVIFDFQLECEPRSCGHNALHSVHVGGSAAQAYLQIGRITGMEELLGELLLSSPGERKCSIRPEPCGQKGHAKEHQRTRGDDEEEDGGNAQQ